MAATSVPVVIHFYRKKYVLLRRAVAELLSEFPSNVDPPVDMGKVTIFLLFTTNISNITKSCTRTGVIQNLRLQVHSQHWEWSTGCGCKILSVSIWRQAPK